ncbi:MAG TPA: malto-oligosyltrehalose synthase [Candidatus Limnocylindria bacterium]
MLRPRASYRVQLHAGFTLDDAAALVPYLAELGVSHLYTSPLLQAVPGSTHGYDVVDHGRVSEDLGGADALARLADAIQGRGMGLVVDIVPNHMAISSDHNRWWWDVLAHGRASRYASFFDVDWGSGDAVVLPLLSDDEVDAPRLVRDGAGLLFAHGHRRFPIDPATLPGTPGDAEVTAINADRARLEALLENQHYRLVSWRAAPDELNYRRFFDVNELIGLRVEDPAVFAETHRLILRWVADGLVQGLRVDHPDGLRDPAGYLARLRAAAPGAWIVAEKILGAEESLPSSWPVDGTTGYRFANLATGLFVDGDGEAGMSAVWASVADGPPGWDAVAAGARLEVLDALLGSDLNRLTDLFAAALAVEGDPDLPHRGLREVLCDVVGRLPVYRTYVTAVPRHVSDDDAALIRDTVAAAAEARPDLDRRLFELLERMLRLEAGGGAGEELALRFQQLTPAAMAKGVEDTAFYRHHRLVALNEVGGDPGRFGTTPETLHRLMQAATAWPAAMLALSTHDTKRSADVRARLAVLSEDPQGWQDAVAQLSAASEAHRDAIDLPSAADAYLFFQSVIGAWPIGAERLAAYMIKASREGKRRTSWTAPDPAYEAALARFVGGCMGDPRFLDLAERLVRSVIDAGRRAALGQLALQLTAPGVPDVYQGNELWDLSLVDPDNRRPVDFDVRRRLLAEARNMGPEDAWARRDEGVPKLWLIHRALALRLRHAAAFGSGGSYRPLVGTGGLAAAIVAFERGEEIASVVPRHVRRVERLGWDDTYLELPAGRWRNLDGSTHAGRARLSALLAPFPVALLERAA